MTHIFRHPKYYKEMRKLQAASAKHQAPSDKHQASSDGELRAKAYAKLASRIVGKPQAPSVKLRSSFVESTKHQADIKNHE